MTARDAVINLGLAALLWAALIASCGALCSAAPDTVWRPLRTPATRILDSLDNDTSMSYNHLNKRRSYGNHPSDNSQKRAREPDR